MARGINYRQMVNRAFRQVMVEVLSQVAREGLPGKHHFFITFDTHAEGVDIPEWLAERYPDEMTIVMQEWFDDLIVEDDGFAVTLNFGDERVRMAIPFEAIHTFVDPSVEFGLRFEPTDGDLDLSDDESPMTHVEDEDEGPHDAEIVSLDAFRKT